MSNSTQRQSWAGFEGRAVSAANTGSVENLAEEGEPQNVETAGPAVESTDTALDESSCSQTPSVYSIKTYESRRTRRNPNSALPLSVAQADSQMSQSPGVAPLPSPAPSYGILQQTPRPPNGSYVGHAHPSLAMYPPVQQTFPNQSPPNPN